MTAGHRRDVELTFRGLVLGALITIVFMSANAYLGLKTGITFSSSIPAAVMSMSLLKLAGGGGILENNIVQTQASAAGTLCNINLVLPGLVLIHYWNGFPLWQTMSVCLLGGLLGVAFSVPLRRVMVVDSDLPFPEGVAAAEVLVSGHNDGDRTGDERESDGGIRDLGLSALVAALFSLMTAGTRVLSDKIGGVLVLGQSVFKLDLGLSLALIGIGYLVRLGCCLALLIGILIAWGIAVPILSIAIPGGEPSAAADVVWAEKVRLIGAGLIAVAGLWTVWSLVRPVIDTIRSSFGASTRDNSSARDIPIAFVGAIIAILLIPVAVLFWVFLSGSKANVSLALFVPALTAITAIFAVLMATACGYLAGLLGSSSSPISGIAILTIMLVIGCSVVVLPSATPDDARFVAATALFVTAIIITASSIANDNLQDLKAGHIVGATPWKQQVALAIGVVLGAITIAPVLQLLYEAYGFVGALPRVGMDSTRAMQAPQAALLAQVADGIVNHRLNWTMVEIGAGLGVVFVALESVLRRRKFTLPALSVGIGIYLPCAIVLTIAAGGVLGWLAERAVSSPGAQDACRRRGVLLSSGFLVGESVVGILVALTDIFLGRSGALSIANGQGSFIRSLLSIVLFAMLSFVFYRLISRPKGEPRGRATS